MAMNTTTPSEARPGRSIGAALQRREDPELVTGEAEYADDLAYPGTLHLSILRSQYAHARIRAIDTDAAEALDGVRAVYTREDLLDAGLSGDMPGDDPDFGASVDRPILVDDVARFQGDAIAAVVAEDRYLAQDALDEIEVEYDRLDATAEVGEALAESGPTVHDAVENNVAFEWEGGAPGATEAAFEDAHETVEIDLDINRVIAAPMEPRGAVARYHDSTGELTVELSCQKVHDEQDRFAEVLGLPEHRISVRAPAVGGGFGVKVQSYAAHYLTAWCSMQLDRPVKWRATRTEDCVATNHSRHHDLTARAAMDDGGRLTAIHVDSTANVGAYLTEGGSIIPSAKVGSRILGAYDVPAAHVEVTGVFTNTTPLSAYRGAGRPEATYIIERLASACARKRGEDPLEFRRRNFIDPGAFPYETPFGTVYDSGDYEKPLRKALDTLDYEALRERQADLREEGRYLGIGFSTYTTTCGAGAGAVEGGGVRVTPSGKAVVMSSMAENGQGHATGFSQIVADTLGVDHDDIAVVEGDTDRVPEGGGTGGSKAMTTSGSAILESAEAIRERARRIAARRLEADPEDVTFEDGEFALRGVPDRSMSFEEVAAEAYSGDLPPELRGLEETTFFSPGGETAPFGTHAAVVEVDPATGDVSIERYVAVDDVGTQINPTLVEGQIVGGIAQAVGQALYERVAYDDNATLLTGSLQDYAVPKSIHLPEVEWDSTVTPSPNNPLGVKGVGEAGTIAAMPAVVNAVADALEPLGVDGVDMPLTPERVHRLIRDAD